MRKFRYRKRRFTRFKGLTYRGRGVYVNEDGDEFKRIGKRKFLQMTDVQMGWRRLSRRETKERQRLNFINNLLGYVFIGFIILVIWLISKFF